MSKRRANAVYLADVNFPDALTPTASLDAALDGAGMVVLAVPSHGLRHVLETASSTLSQDSLVVSATKGL
jgi:glycerol-3-phosphate dehydrogenase (NAD(P)+)